MHKYLFIVSIFCIDHATAPAQVRPNVIDDFVEESLDAWQVPGIAVGIVHNGRVVYLKGFGVKRLGGNERVTPDTLFAIGSCTKSFTTTAMAMLIDDGRLHWDDPVRKYLDYFRLADPTANEQATLRDLICHRTGVGTHDLLWYNVPWSQHESIQKVGRLKPIHPFRSRFQYQVALVSAAGFAAAKAAGMSWEQLIRKRLFEPLGIKRACLTTDELKKFDDVADPHRFNRNGKLEAIPWYPMRKPIPSGSVITSARELCKYVQLHLDGGMFRGKRLVSKKNLNETHKPQVVIPFDDYLQRLHPFTNIMCYGLAWLVQDYRGQLVVQHGGAIDGFRAQITLVPKAGLGIVLLNNLDHTQMNMAISNTIVDWYLRNPYKDWTSHVQGILRKDEAKRNEATAKFLAGRKKGTTPTLKQPAYFGKYVDPVYGEAVIAAMNDGLTLKWSNFRCALSHFHDDTFLANDGILIDEPVVFEVIDGRVVSMRFVNRAFRRKTP